MLETLIFQALQMAYLYNESSPRFGGLAHCLPMAYNGAAVPGGKASQWWCLLGLRLKERMPAVV
jgi:hypothetical protein